MDVRKVLLFGSMIFECGVSSQCDCTKRPVEADSAARKRSSSLWMTMSGVSNEPVTCKYRLQVVNNCKSLPE
jgi:hypothetical protein